MKKTAMTGRRVANSKITPREILSASKKLYDTQVSWRRHLHMYPEVANTEFKTTAFIQDLVEKQGLRVLPIMMKTGVLAELKGSKPGPTIAIRADIDALPITEETNLPFKSRHVGCMHACGHDVHTATGLGVAHLLASMRERLCGTVRFIFQPAEECPPGGARPMIANGALKDVSTIFSLHVDPTVPVGHIGLRDGAALAAAIDFDLIIHGLSGHAARPHGCIDALVTGAEVIHSLQTIVSREVDPISPVAITIGQFHSGTARNVIAQTAHIIGTARTLSPEIAKQLPVLIKRTASSICAARGARLEMKLIADYPPMINDANVNKRFARGFERLYGDKEIITTPQSLGGEDFACYLEKVPGAMVRIGVQNKKIGADKPWHHPAFMVDERSLTVGTAVLSTVICDALGVLSDQ
ncbi:MAG: amidohydrolase [Candidatus Zixiibacteriota bacterium]